MENYTSAIDTISHGKILENVPFISQLGAYPTGCESVSTVMALQYLGADISVDRFIDDYLPRGDIPVSDESGEFHGSDPWAVFPGDPRSEEGWGCFAPVISGAVENYSAGAFKVNEIYGKSVDELCRDYIDKGLPVVFWATMHMDEPKLYRSWLTPEGKTVNWISPMHCLLLIGYDGESYYFNDPTAGECVKYSKESVCAAYQAQGSQAVVIYK